ncbi:MAG TPA: NAD(P)-binding domain-containing protein, partial [Anaerolineae bacterium]|nr:NAD(P)-binding domain-containing protein [Anaerolineae bacterium]
MLNHKSVAFIGSGVMAEAMIKGLLRKGLVKTDQIIASGPRPERGQALFDRYAVRTTTDNIQAASQAE